MVIIVCLCLIVNGINGSTLQGTGRQLKGLFPAHHIDKRRVRRKVRRLCAVFVLVKGYGNRISVGIYNVSCLIIAIALNAVEKRVCLFGDFSVRPANAELVRRNGTRVL